MMRGTFGLVRVMLSVIIPTRDSERLLVHTLVALVPGATAGVVREVIVADGGSRDETEQVADIAGCVFLSSGQSLGARLKAAAERARGDWLMFLSAGHCARPELDRGDGRFRARKGTSGRVFGTTGRIGGPGAPPVRGAAGHRTRT